MDNIIRFTFRISSELFDKIEKIANINHRSVNSQIITILEEYLLLNDTNVSAKSKNN